MEVYPSIMAANWLELKKNLNQIKSADGIHVDIMDGHFVPNLTFGPDVVAKERKGSKLPFMLHLMVEEPEKILKRFIPLLKKNDLVFLHAEIPAIKISKTLAMLEKKGIRAGIAMNPETDILKKTKISGLLGNGIKDILIMGVHPGFYGQKMLPGTIRKIEIIKRKNPDLKIYVDGGVTLQNAKLLKKAGADGICAGKAIFESENPAKAIKTFHRI